MSEDIIQGTDAWLKLRLGKVTASRVADVVARTKTGPSASRASYMAQLVAERLTNTVQATFANAAMVWGTETEPEAQNAYSFYVDADVVQIGFVNHPRIDMSGASPDGLIGTDGLLELKCPQTSTHIETLLGGAVPAKYLTQMQWQMATTERQWCDFASYDPRLPQSMRLFVKRVTRDDGMIASLEKQVIEFLAELDETVAELQRRYAGQLEAA